MPVQSYTFTRYFLDIFKERTGCEPNEDNLAEVLSVCNNTNPHQKIDNRGRNSAYFTFSLQGNLITVVCDPETRKVITCIQETHNRRRFTRHGSTE